MSHTHTHTHTYMYVCMYVCINQVRTSYNIAHLRKVVELIDRNVVVKIKAAKEREKMRKNERKRERAREINTPK